VSSTADESDPVDPCTAFALAVRALTLTVTRYRGTVVRSHSQVGPTDGAALGRLHAEGPQTPTQLARWLGVSTGSITELLDRLESAGHATRTPHPTDRRKLIVTLTDSAREMIIREMLAPMTEALAPVLDDYDEPTRRTIVTVLDQATDALEKAISAHADTA
jgi:DNA-binding MarR family transcriptional regulator